MSVSEQDYELILKYLNDDLNNHEMRQFKKLRNTSEAFAREVENADGALYTLKVKSKVERVHHVEKVMQFFEEDSDGTKPFVWILMGVAVLIATVGIVVFFSLSQAYYPDSLHTFDVYYREFPVPITDDRSLDDLGVNLYVAGRYREAIPHLETLAVDPTRRIAKIYLANAYIKVNDFRSAELTLLSLRISDRSWHLSQHKYWYLALIYLKKGEDSRAVDIFQKLASAGGVYARQAAELAEQLR